MSEAVNPWPLRAVALIIALLIWLFASFLPRLEELTETELTVPLSYAAAPDGMIADPNRPSDVAVRIRGREDDLNAISSDSIRVTVPLPTPIEPGVATEVQLSETDVAAPDGIEILSFSPPTVFMIIDQLEEVSVRVVPEFRGQPGAGRTRDDIRWEARPEEVVVRGPRAALDSLTTLATAPIDVNGRAIDFSQQAAVRLPDNPALSARPNFVMIDVKLEPEPIEPDDGESPPEGQ